MLCFAYLPVTNRAYVPMANGLKYIDYIVGFLSLLLIVLIFGSAAEHIVSAWDKEEYSHGYFIPVIAVFLAWHRLAEVRPVLRPSWWGIVCIALGGIMALAARLSAFDTIPQYG